MVISEKKIMAVGAHPDDIEYGCGGLLKEAEVAIGVTVSATDDHSRRAEIINASKLLNYTPVFVDQTKHHIDGEALITFIENCIQTYHPDIITVHWPNDTHQDHRVVTESVISAARAFRGAIMFFRSPSSIDFTPNLFVELENDIWEMKVEAICSHHSQKDKLYLHPEWLKASFSHWPENYRGNPGPCEPFFLRRMVLNGGKGQ